MNQWIFEEKLNELVRELGPLPDPTQQKLLEITREHRDTQEKLNKSLHSMQESLDYLRVCVKYLLFDLEATRRENLYLKKLLEDHTDR